MVSAKLSSKKSARSAEVERELPSDSIRATWREICHKQHALMIAMIALTVAAAGLLIVSFSALRPQSTVVIVGYGDVYGEIAGISGGYRRDSWLNMFAFPILAILFGVLHNLLVIRIFRKYGRDAALAFTILTILLIAVTYVVMFRLIGEW